MRIRNSKFGRPSPASRSALALLAVLGVTAALVAGCDRETAAADAAAPQIVGVQRPARQEVAEWREFTGRLAAVETAEVRARVSGFVDRVHFEEGSLVAAGDLLYTLDPRPIRADLERLEARRQEAEIRLELARSEAARVAPLAEQRAVSAEEIEQRRQDVEMAVAALAATEAELQAVRLDLGFTRVVAPVAGRVGRTQVTRGNLVSGGSGESTVLTTVVSLDPIYFYFTPDERTARRLLGRDRSTAADAITVTLEVSDDGGAAIRGTVDFFDNRVDPATGTLLTRAVFANPGGGLLPGMFGRLKVQVGEPHPALLVPEVAIGHDQTQELVFVVDDQQTVERRPVKTGIEVGGWRVIESGLGPDDRVVVEGIQSVRSGRKVVAEPADVEPPPPTGAESGG